MLALSVLIASSTLIVTTNSLHAMLNKNKGAGMTVEIDIEDEKTTLYLRAYVAPYDWFAISFMEQQHVTDAVAVVYGIDGGQQLNDILFNGYDEPTILTTSAWTLENLITIGDMTSIIASRPNTIEHSEINYPDFSLSDFNEVPVIWAHGTSTDSPMDAHTVDNAVTTYLTRHPFLPTDRPTKEPTMNPTWPSPTNGPSMDPTKEPSYTHSPSSSPSQSPSISPSQSPSVSPSKSPSDSPSESPSKSPTTSPSISPSKSPSSSPTTGTPTINLSDSQDDTTNSTEVCGVFIDNSQCDDYDEQCCILSPFCQPVDDTECESLTLSPTSDPITSSNPTSSPTSSLSPTSSPTMVDIVSQSAELTEIPTSSPTFPKTTTRTPTLKPTTPLPTSSSSPTGTPTSSPLTELVPLEDTPCECQNGIEMIRWKYNGPKIAKKIFIHGYDRLGWKKTICTYNDVAIGAELVCDMTQQVLSPNFGGIFPKITFVSIQYEATPSTLTTESAEGSSSCTGSMRTSCDIDIVYQTDVGCESLLVIGWNDNLIGEECNESNTGNIGPNARIDFTVNAITPDAHHTDSESSTRDIVTHGVTIAAGLFAVMVILCVLKCLKNMDKGFIARTMSSRRQLSLPYNEDDDVMIPEIVQRERPNTIELSDSSTNYVIDGERKTGMASLGQFMDYEDDDRHNAMVQTLSSMANNVVFDVNTGKAHFETMSQSEHSENDEDHQHFETVDSVTVTHARDAYNDHQLHQHSGNTHNNETPNHFMMEMPALSLDEYNI